MDITLRSRRHLGISSCSRSRNVTTEWRRMATRHGQGSLYLGVDFGTSGARATLIDEMRRMVHEVKMSYDKTEGETWDAVWSRTLDGIFLEIPTGYSQDVVSLAFDGTSATTMLIDEETGISLEPPKMYNASQNSEAVQFAKSIAPEGHPARASTSTLCKAIAWHLEKKLENNRANGTQPRVLHQADWLSYLMHGHARRSDYTNALKLGYDPELEAYPEWLRAQAFFEALPEEVVAPGTPVGSVLPSVRTKYGLPDDCIVCAGTTDSIAAFLAAGAEETGEAVTSLGSTLAIKMLTTQRVDAVDYGVYSHRLGDRWLVGGASNTGGAVLKSFFDAEQLRTLSARIHPDNPTQLDYYPLPSPGERFPINDPQLQPRMQPRPEDDVLFLHGMLEGIAKIEGRCYRLLKELGGGEVKRVLTAGGGAGNPQWTEIRQRTLGVPVFPASNGEASYGAALLAKRGRDRQNV